MAKTIFIEQYYANATDANGWVTDMPGRLIKSSAHTVTGTSQVISEPFEEDTRFLIIQSTVDIYFVIDGAETVVTDQDRVLFANQSRMIDITDTICHPTCLDIRPKATHISFKEHV